MAPKKPSGAVYRKLKKERTVRERKLSNQWTKWMKSKETSPTTSLSLRHNEFDKEPCLETKNLEDDAEDEPVREVPGTISSKSSVSSKEAVNNYDTDNELESIAENNCGAAINDTQFPFNDPVKWPKITDNVKTLLIEHGPDQNKNADFRAGATEDGRCFNSNLFCKQLKNGETVARKWLLYSSSKHAVFCFPCSIFSHDSHQLTDVTKGLCDWVHMNSRLSQHETSPGHANCCGLWKEFEKRLKTGQCIDDKLQDAINCEKEKWRGILKVIIDAILFCAKNNTALRGSSDDFDSRNCGIFLNTIELISHYYPLIAEHIKYAKINKSLPKYLSPDVQNEIILMLGTNVRKEIVSRVRKSKYFSMMFDCTPDTSHKEQMSQVLRYVDIKEDGQCTIEESFIDFIESHEKTGRGIATEILQKLDADGLDIVDCRGQGYDNGANMSGKYNGVQAVITQQNSLATFVPCAAHSLNLVGVHAAEVSPIMITFFGRVEMIFKYFSGSTSRWTMLVDATKITLKGHSATRWSSKKNAVSPLNHQLEEVYRVLSKISNDNSLNAETISGAQSLLKQLDFTFICLLSFWTTILDSVDRINRALQAKNLSLDGATKMISGLVMSMKDIRAKGVAHIIENARLVAGNLGLEENFPEKRRKKSKRMPGERAEDEGRLLSPEDEFSRECMLVLDNILSQIEWRFETMSGVLSNFQFLRGESLAAMPTDILKKHAADLALLYSCDLNLTELEQEITNFKFQSAALLDSESNLATSTPLDLLQLIHTYAIKDMYPNVEIALRLFLTIPITVASCERSFSKLKLIKNYLRSSMGQGRLSSLAIISIEVEIAKCIDYEKAVDEFASMKARRVVL
jgi:hypothetical protein